MKNFTLTLLILLFAAIGAQAQHSVARLWNEANIEAIRNDLARPPVHARNLFHVSVAMYDAWAAFDDEVQTYLLGKTIGNFTSVYIGFSTTVERETARREAISYAAYRVLRRRFSSSPGASNIIPMLNELMADLGYDIAFTSTDYSTGSPAALGNYIAAQVIAFGLQDGSNEQLNHNNTYYQPSNPALVIDVPGNPNMADPNRWQPLTLDVFIDQNGNVIPFNTPPFQSPEWGNVQPFAMTEADLTTHQRNGFNWKVYHDPGSPALLDPVNGGPMSDEYIWNHSLVAVWSAHLDHNDGVVWDISPAGIGNVPEGAFPTDLAGLRDFYDLIDGQDVGTGYTVNPKTGQPYTPQMVPRGDYARVLAEFWADGPTSETPPGHWFSILNYVHDQPGFVRRYAGQSEILDDLEWDVKAYLTLGGALHDVAISAWGIKGYYDSSRPVSAIRYMAERGQSSDPGLPNYHPAGFKLIPGYIELIAPGDPLAGANNEYVNDIKLYTWRGPTFIQDPATDEAGVGWIRAKEWWPYQRPTFVTPPFAGYVSGHSTYSRAAAEVLTAITGDPFFPGGMGEFHAPQNQYLVFEEGPSVDLTLQWATYRDAANQCSLSRIWGGIHPPMDDIPGRIIGQTIGVDAFEKARALFYKDEDNDGVWNYADCDDFDNTVYPGAQEICDGKDNNCDGNTDEGVLLVFYADVDGDGFGDANASTFACSAPAGFVESATDCDDADGDEFPGQIWYVDADGDGFSSGTFLANCTRPANGFLPSELTQINGDCNDNDPNQFPGQVWYIDADGDGYGSGDMATVCNRPDNGFLASELTMTEGDCNDSDSNEFPGQIWYRDSDFDGYGDETTVTTCSRPSDGFLQNELVAISGDCDNLNATVYPNAPEVCDGLDNDCDGSSDELLPLYTYYLDADGDGFGDSAFSAETCLEQAPAGYVNSADDCNDGNPNIHPDADDIADNGVDEDCSGLDLFLATKVFPNPTRQGKVFIHLPLEGQLHLRWYNAAGQLVAESRANFLSNQAEVSTLMLAQGVYFMELSTLGNERILLERVVVF